MKSMAIGIFAAVSLGGIAAHGAFTLDEGSELFLTAKLSQQFDDNIFLRTNNAKADSVTIFTPGFDLKFGQNSLGKGSLTFGEAFSWYSSHSSQNSSLARVAFNTTYDDGKTKGTLNAAFNQVAQNSVDVRAFALLVRRDLTDVNGRGEWSLSDKTSFAAGGAYDRIDYKQSQFVSNDQYSLPVDFYYELAPKLDLSVDYRYRETNLAHSLPKFTDHFLGVGARGQFTEKLSGEYHFGYTQRHLGGGGGNQTLFGIDSTFTYQYSPKTTASLGVSNDFASAATGSSQKVFSFTGGVRTQFEEGFSGSGALSYRDLDYNLTNERDYYWEGTLGVQYQVNQYVSLEAAYTYRNNSTNVAADFTDNVFSISGSVRY